MGSIRRISVSESHMKSPSVSRDPHPSDFERFIPWVLRQFDIRNISVKRFNKAEYHPVVVAKKHRKPLKTASVGVLAMPSHVNHDMGRKDSVDSTKEFMREPTQMNLSDHIVISAYYDINGVLVEIAFMDCPMPVPTEVMQIIQLSLPHNPQLTRITWKGAHLTSILVYEISKIIPGSEITDVIFDGCYVPQGNYYLVLDKATKLKYLSLNNCQINDEVCTMIAERIQRNSPAAENLLVLNLSSNHITDVGAEALGRSLRTNRRLLYLNLCNNDITSVGADHILSPLTKFKLSLDEKMDMRLLKLKTTKKKLAVANVYLEEGQEKKEQKTKLKKKIVPKFEGIENGPQQRDKSAIGDIYLATVMEEKNGSWYSSGNLTLCALNLAYNQLDSATVSRILEVVSYQFNENKYSKTGLLRVVIEGNPLPESCTEYELISKYIDLAIDQSTPPTSLPGNFAKPKQKTSRIEQRSDQRLK